MTLRNSTPLTLIPRGLSDALDATNVFAGAMASLQNLIVDPSTRGLWQCRPAAQALGIVAAGAFSSGFSSGFLIGAVSPATAPGPITVMKIIGNVAYGMVASSSFVGNDVPFAYNLLTNTFQTITGITSSNTPTSPPSSGAWTPPTMDLVGTNLLVTHPGFTGAGGNYFGWIDVSNPSALSWSAGNLTGLVTFSTPPSFVRNFNGRAYWITNPPTGQPAVVFSDVLVPRNVTNANQVITFDDNVPLTALGPLPLNNQLGGIIQGLIVFKGVQNVYQITGDAALSNLAKNALNVATGTLAPNTIVPTPKGLAFVAPDGLRFVDFAANVSDPLGVDGMGKVLPFIYSVVPSRMVAAANGSVIRISTQDGSLNGSPNVEYWLDLPRQVWSGPHTFAAACIAPWNNTFIVAPVGIQASLWRSDYVQNSTSTFVENGTQMTFNWTTAMLPDTNQMSENAMIETTIYMAQAPGATYGVFALDQNGSVIQQSSVSNTAQPTKWGSFTWGSAPWGGGTSALFPRRVDWPKPVVFRRMQMFLQGNSDQAVRIGMLHMKYEKLGYLQQGAAA